MMDNTVGGLVGAVCAATFLFFVVLLMLLILVKWNNVYRQLQLAKGRVKMPMWYWKKKKDRATRHLLHGHNSLSSGSNFILCQGGHSHRDMNEQAPDLNAALDTDPIIPGQKNAEEEEGRYEEKGVDIQLPVEEEEEFRIVTTLDDPSPNDLDTGAVTSTPTPTPDPNPNTAASDSDSASATASAPPPAVEQLATGEDAMPSSSSTAVLY